MVREGRGRRGELVKKGRGELVREERGGVRGCGRRGEGRVGELVSDGRGRKVSWSGRGGGERVAGENIINLYTTYRSVHYN